MTEGKLAWSSAALSMCYSMAASIAMRFATLTVVKYAPLSCCPHCGSEMYNLTVPCFHTRPIGTCSPPCANGADVRSRATFSHCFALRLVALHGVCRAQRGLSVLYEPSVKLDLPLQHDAGDVVHTLERLVAICEARAFVHGRLDHAHAARSTDVRWSVSRVQVGVEVA